MASILLFPHRFRLGRAKHVAKIWVGRRGGQRHQYWNNVVAAECQVLRRIGFSEEAIAGAIEDLADAVNREIAALDTVSSRRHDDHSPGAA